jgi:transcription antitermination factor NusG
MMEVIVSDFVMFEEDDLVRVVAGPFSSFIGVVEEVDEVRIGCLWVVGARHSSTQLGPRRVDHRSRPTPAS